jgi:hypothetical protein
MNLEILNVGYSYEVWDYDGHRMFEGTLAECEDFVYEASMDDQEYDLD